MGEGRGVVDDGEKQGWQGRGGAGGAGRKKSAPRAGARGAIKMSGAQILIHLLYTLQGIEPCSTISLCNVLTTRATGFSAIAEIVPYIDRFESAEL
jgi:hypothetical protein